MNGKNKLTGPLKYLAGLRRGQTPGQLILQITERCNATCPQCGMNTGNNKPRSELSLDRVRALFDAAAAKGFSALSFTGGEPLLRLEELTAMIDHAGAAGIGYIRTGTNGFFLARPERPGFLGRVERVARALAGTPLRNFWISLDSADPATHEEMRGFPGLVRGLEQALPIFHAHGLYPCANLGFNRNLGGVATSTLKPLPGEDQETYLARFEEAFSRALDAFYQRVMDLGFTMASTCYPMSLDEDSGREGLAAVYGASSVDDVIRFSRAEKAVLFRVLLKVVPRFRDRLRIFTPLSSVLALARQHGASAKGSPEPRPCRGGLDYFFVDAAKGHAFPCGYRGLDDLGPFEELRPELLDRSASCRRCDWECFRDPSELMGPLLQAARGPLSALAGLGRDRAARRAWLSDLSYYRACRLFDGRRPPEPARLAGHALRAEGEPTP